MHVIARQDMEINCRKSDDGLFISTFDSGEIAGRFAYDRLFEYACPFSTLGLKANDKVNFFMQIEGKDRIIEKVPTDNMLSFTVPTKAFEQDHWTV